MAMVKSRNESSHTYNEDVTRKIVDAITDDYCDAFCVLNKKLNELAEKEKQG